MLAVSDFNIVMPTEWLDLRAGLNHCRTRKRFPRRSTVRSAKESVDDDKASVAQKRSRTPSSEGRGP